MTSTPPPYTGTAPQFTLTPSMTAPPPLMPSPTLPGRLVAPGRRFWALILDLTLFYFTAGIGWLIWSIVTWERGQTPAGSLMGHMVVDVSTGRPLDRGQMAVRELLIKYGLGLVAGSLTGGVYTLVDGLVALGDRRASLHDRIVGSAVLHAPHRSRHVGAVG